MIGSSSDKSDPPKKVASMSHDEQKKKKKKREKSSDRAFVFSREEQLLFSASAPAAELLEELQNNADINLVLNINRAVDPWFDLAMYELCKYSLVLQQSINVRVFPNAKG